MRKVITVLLTIAVIAALNWGTAYFLSLAFLDIAILVGGLAIAITYFFKSKGGMASRQTDMAIQGQTGIRMEQQQAVTERSYIFIGTIVYTAVMLVITFISYREYFMG